MFVEWKKYKIYFAGATRIGAANGANVDRVHRAMLASRVRSRMLYAAERAESVTLRYFNPLLLRFSFSSLLLHVASLVFIIIFLNFLLHILLCRANSRNCKFKSGDSGGRSRMRPRLSLSASLWRVLFCYRYGESVHKAD